VFFNTPCKAGHFETFCYTYFALRKKVYDFVPTQFSAQSNEYEIVKKSGKLIIYTLAIAQEKEQTNAPMYMTKKVISFKQMTEISNNLMKH